MSPVSGTSSMETDRAPPGRPTLDRPNRPMTMTTAAARIAVLSFIKAPTVRIYESGHTDNGRTAHGLSARPGLLTGHGPVLRRRTKCPAHQLVRPSTLNVCLSWPPRSEMPHVLHCWGSAPVPRLPPSKLLWAWRRVL